MKKAPVRFTLIAEIDPEHLDLEALKNAVEEIRGYAEIKSAKLTFTQETEIAL